MLDGHEFELDLPPEPLAADADREKLRQIVTDLVENAVKYSPGGGTVRVSARRRDDTVEASVDDEGIGIPQSEQSRIFAKFYRADSAGRDLASGGTGLGLFIAKELLAAMHGRIWVRSAHGEGSTFVFSLPLSSTGSQRARVNRARNGYEARQRRGRMTRVLVIDDEPPIRLLCRVNLEAEGMEVLEASDGPTGLEKARNDQPDVITAPQHPSHS